MPRLQRSVIVLGVILAGVCAPSCGGGKPSETVPPILRIGVGTPPGPSNTGSGGLVSLLKADTWLSSKIDGQIGPRIVTDWRWEQHGTVLRLKLRPNVYFHDGTSLTAATAAEALRAADTSTDHSLQSIASIQPEGSDTLVLTLKEPNAFLLPDLGSVPVTEAGHPDVGTGPYQIMSRKGQDATLRAFPRYYHGRPALAGVDVVTYPTQRNAWTALMRGDIDMLYEVSRDSTEFVQAETTVHTYSFLRPYYIPLVFNMRHPFLRNIEVRRAINGALDRAALIRDGMRGQGVSADGPVWPKHWAYTPPEQFNFDPAAARVRLDSAGYPLKPSPQRGLPVRLGFTCLVLGDDSRFERLAVLIQKQLADVGIDMQIEPVMMRDMVTRAGKGDFDAFLFELSGPRLSRVYDFWRSSDKSMINSGYRAADAVLDRLRSAQSDAETRAGVAELMRIMHDDPPAAFIAWQRSSRAVSTRFDVAAEPDRDILTSLWLWRPAAAPGQMAR
jgi:peptide/nickel transport system substrate-binding protein